MEGSTKKDVIDLTLDESESESEPEPKIVREYVYNGETISVGFTDEEDNDLEDENDSLDPLAFIP
jgi:hypothetical protein